MIASVILGSIYLAFSWILRGPAPDTGSESVVITIGSGMTLSDVTRMLDERGLINSPLAFKLAARLMGVDRKIQPGSFLIDRGATNTRVLRLLLQPMIRTNDVTIPEGLSIYQIASIFRREMGLDSSEFIAACEDPDFASMLGVPGDRLEGYLFPDTYNFYLDTPVRGVLEKMVDHFFRMVPDSMQMRMTLAGMSLRDVVTLASIIEGEVQIAAEASIVSAVYHNRIKKGMALEADPTIQYILPEGPRRLRRSDLKIDNPYNTYLHRGLPPGPICNPGLRSIRAAFNPAKVDYLYFVAQGDGSHAFNRKYDDHLTSKQKLDKIRRELDMEKRQNKQG
jgi:UPF0755 protein